MRNLQIADRVGSQFSRKQLILQEKPLSNKEYHPEGLIDPYDSLADGPSLRNLENLMSAIRFNQAQKTSIVE